MELPYSYKHPNSLNIVCIELINLHKMKLYTHYLKKLIGKKTQNAVWDYRQKTRVICEFLEIFHNFQSKFLFKYQIINFTDRV